MKRGYSKFALLFFVMAVVFRALILLLSQSNSFIVGFYACLSLGIVMLALDTLPKKTYANAFCYDNRFFLNVFSYIGAAGFLTDFMLQALNIYNYLNTFQYNVLLAVIPSLLQCAFAILSSVCFVIMGMSFSNRKDYDVRNLGAFNIVVLVYFISKGLSVLTNISKLNQIDTTLYYISIIFGILCAFSYAKEIDNTKGAKPASVFCFRCYSYVAMMYFIFVFTMVLKGNEAVRSEYFATGIITLFIGMFNYFFEKNILAHSVLE